jgi:hypothetical protein
MNLIIRDVPAATHANMQAEANRKGLSQQEMLLNRLEEWWREAPTVVMWISGKLGQQDPETTCPECGRVLSNPHVGLLSNRSFTIVVCGLCATKLSKRTR